jgi:DNA-binding HxlR family transcriptional regulator
MLTRTLRGLEEDGSVCRKAFATNPPSVEYSLTPIGRSLLEPLPALAASAIEHQPTIAASRRVNNLRPRNT